MSRVSESHSSSGEWNVFYPRVFPFSRYRWRRSWWRFVTLWLLCSTGSSISTSLSEYLQWVPLITNKMMHRKLLVRWKWVFVVTELMVIAVNCFDAQISIYVENEFITNSTQCISVWLDRFIQTAEMLKPATPTSSHDSSSTEINEYYPYIGT